MAVALLCASAVIGPVNIAITVINLGMAGTGMQLPINRWCQGFSIATELSPMYRTAAARLHACMH